MQRTGARIAIKIHKVTIAGDAEFYEIKISIQTLQRVKCPGDALDLTFKRGFALCELEVKTDLKVAPAPVVSNGSHVRMNRNVTLFKSRNPVGETNHLLAFKRAKQNSACVLAGNEHH